MSETQQFTPQNPHKYDAIQVLSAAGFNNAAIAKAFGNDRSNITVAKRNMQRNPSLKDAKRIRAALKAHDTILKAATNSKAKDKLQFELRGADVTKAIDRVMDRVEPTKQEQSGGNTFQFFSINLSAYNSNTDRSEALPEGKTQQEPKLLESLHESY